MSALTHADHPAPASGRSRERGGARLADLAWLTWRQHRTVIIAGLAIAAAVTGSMLYVAARITAINTECVNAACPDGSAQAARLGGSFMPGSGAGGWPGAVPVIASRLAGAPRRRLAAAAAPGEAQRPRWGMPPGLVMRRGRQASLSRPPGGAGLARLAVFRIKSGVSLYCDPLIR